MNKKILIITKSISPGGGPAGYVYNLMSGIERLSKEGLLRNDFDFIGDLHNQRNKPREQGTESTNWGLRSAIIWLLTKLGAKPFLSKKIRVAKNKIKACDLVIFQGYQETYLPAYARKKKIPVIYMPHSPVIFADEYKMLCELDGIKIDPKRYRKLKTDEELLITYSDFVVFPSKGSRKEYDSNFISELSKKKVLYIKSGVNINFLDKVIEIDDDRDVIKILFVGRYVTHKGYDLFCDAAKLICKNISNVQFLTIGQGPMKRISASITDLGWRNDALNIINSCDIIVVPNRVAYYDLLPIECAALGKPMVMTTVGGNLDQLSEFPDCIACNELTLEALCEAVLAAINVKKSNSNWGAANSEKYRSDFTERSFAKRWDDAVSGI